jgi:hypothetical protein
MCPAHFLCRKKSDGLFGNERGQRSETLAWWLQSEWRRPGELAVFQLPGWFLFSALKASCLSATPCRCPIDQWLASSSLASFMTGIPGRAERRNLGLPCWHLLRFLPHSNMSLPVWASHTAPPESSGKDCLDLGTSDGLDRRFVLCPVWGGIGRRGAAPLTSQGGVIR